jgi:hypothetical protein
MHKLALVALIGLTTSAAFIGAAAAIGGKDFAGNMDFPAFGDRPRCEAVPNATATTRDLDWDSSDQVSLSVGGHATYTPGTDNKVHASGDPQVLAHLEVRDGRIELDCNGWHHDTSSLNIILPGREFKQFAIAGSGNLALEKLNQPMVTVRVAGSGSIRADGKVDHAEVRIAGSGDIDMGRVASQVSDVHISGSGDTDIAPAEEADIRISGSGDVNLHSNPKRLETHISGSGHIHNMTTSG